MSVCNTVNHFEKEVLCDGDLRDHVHADQRATAQNSAVDQADGHIQAGFWDYARFGIPITILTAAAGVLVLLLLH